MPDPLTSLGLASNIVHLVLFSYELVKGGNEIYNSLTGASKENQSAEEAATDLADHTNDLNASLEDWTRVRSGAQLDPVDYRLRVLCGKTLEVAADLTARLAKLKVEDGASFRRVKCYYYAVVSAYSKSQRKAIAGRLEAYQKEIDTSILVGLRKKAAKLDVESAKRFKSLDSDVRSVLAAVLEGHKVLLSVKDDTNQIKGDTRRLVAWCINGEKLSPEEIGEPEALHTATPLHEAAESGDLANLKKLLRSTDNDTSTPDEQGCTPLHLARNEEVAARLLQKGPLAKDVEDSCGRRPLHYAVLKRRLGTVKVLLESGVDEDWMDNGGRAAAFYARDCPAITWLLENGPKVETLSKANGTTGLIYMAWLGDMEGANFFFGQGS